MSLKVICHVHLVHIDDRDQKLLDLCDKIQNSSLSNDGERIEKDEYIPVIWKVRLLGGKFFNMLGDTDTQILIIEVLNLLLI